MKVDDLDDQLRLQKIRISELEAEVALLKQRLSVIPLSARSLNTEFVANHTLKNAIDTAQSGKWWDASVIVANHYGIDFMIKKSVNFDVLKKSMYEYFQMPMAPGRLDKSAMANDAREQRKRIKAMVYTYIDRMGDYYLRRSGF